IRANALLGLAELKDERVLPIAIEWTRRGKSNPVRGAATAVLGKLARINDRVKDDAYERLIELLNDEWLRVRLNAIAALVEVRDAKAIGELNRVTSRDLDGRVIRAAREGMSRLREGTDPGDAVKKLRDDFDKLLEDNRSLKDRLDKLESWTNGAKPAKRAAAASKAAARASSNGRKPAAAPRGTS